MTSTMAVVSLAGLVPGHRYDCILGRSGTFGWYRHQTPAARSRWRRLHGGPSSLPVDTAAELVAGPALIEVADEEVLFPGLGDEHPPRNVGLRAERVRTGWNGGHMPAGRLDAWLSEWRDAVGRGDHLWLGARTHKNGRIRAKAPGAATTSVPGGALTLTATETPTTAAGTENGADVTASVKKASEYPPVIRGTVARPNGEAYRVRKIGKKHDVAVFREMRERGVHILTIGQPGCGKTALTEAAFGDQMITVMGTEDLESADLIGGYIETDDGRWVWVDGPLVIAMERGWVLYIDEIGVVRQKQMAQLYSVMDGRNVLQVTANPKRGVVEAAPGFAVVGSTNPDSPEVRLTDAILNRYGLKLTVNTDFAMARDQFGIPAWLTGAAENLETRRRARELPWAPQMRDLRLWATNVEVMGEAEATGSMINSAPAPSRAAVGDVLSKAFGKRIKALELS